MWGNISYSSNVGTFVTFHQICCNLNVPLTLLSISFCFQNLLDRQRTCLVLSDEGRKLCEECWVCETKQGVLWSRKWVAWLLDDPSARMLLLLDPCFPTGAKSGRLWEEIAGFDAEPAKRTKRIYFQHLLGPLSCCCRCCWWCSSSTLQLIHFKSFDFALTWCFTLWHNLTFLQP